jgi:epoxyqueuosine reductase
MSLESKIKKLAMDIGFDLVGITTADPFERDEEAASQRVRDGLMDGLPWYTLERVQRMNRPQILLDGARSVISLAVSYNATSDDNDNQLKSGDAGPQLTGKFARYARGDDYHDVIKKRLRRFVDELPDILGRAASTRVFVDDGPMNDRAAAERAGVGWFGKNTNILTPSHGSWVFLAQVITDVELRQDIPLKKTCGNCVRCIDDCPTGAIVAPYVLDNRKCISYLTIELRGVIPRELRPLMGDWVFGCDICQDVCPVNWKAAKGSETAFQKRHDFDAPELLPLLEMDDEEFRERFRNSPIKRTKRKGLQRNVCVALGNLGDARAIPALRKALVCDESLIRLHAAWALGRIGGGEALGCLKLAIAQETDPDVLDEIKITFAEWESRDL